MEPGPLRRLFTVGVVAIIAILLLYLFAAKQVTDTESPRVAALAHDVLQRNLVKDSKTTLVLRTRRPDDSRHYELRIHPAERLVDDPAALATLLLSAAELVLEEVGERKAETTVTCVAVLPNGERRVTYDRRLQSVTEPVLPASDGSE